ncbi:MAG: sn-glycerol-1-phosphate dehydrogenase [Clostridia bacterium]|nr:sn-glycerol-1-phosphate dehydrogenase [Clostridia bacterium]
MNLSQATLRQLCKGNFYTCSCGHTHTTYLDDLYIGPGALKHLSEVLDRYHITKPFVVFDENTLSACGDSLLASLQSYTPCNLGKERLEAGEVPLGHIASYWDDTCDGILAIGSGTVNDLSKMMAKMTKVPFVLVGTAPSMDGFVSTSAAMIVDGVKTTINTPMPDTVILDTDILCKAPYRLLAAGLGDMLAKAVSLVEWKIAHLLIDEFYCGEIASLVRRSLNLCLENARDLPSRSETAVKNITEGLVLSGLAMTLAEVTRPASGMEHYVSHILDIRAVQNNTLPDLHGIQVGLGTLVTLRMYDWLLTQKFDRERALRFYETFSYDEWKKKMVEIFGASAPEIIRIEEESGKVDPEKARSRLPRIEEKWEEIQDIIRTELPRADEIESLMKDAGLPTTFPEIGITPQVGLLCFYGTKEIRDKYVGTRLLWDIGLFDDAVEVIRKFLKA